MAADGSCATRQSFLQQKGSVENLCSLFSSAVSTLAADAECLRQISSLRLAVDDDAPFQNADADENVDPNVSRLSLEPVSSEMLATVFLLEENITALEGNLIMLRDTIGDEKRALRGLEELTMAAQEQANIIEQINEGCRALQIPNKRTEASIRGNDEVGDTLGKANVAMRQSGHRVHANPADSILLELITESELNSVAKSIRGRITQRCVNDAVTDIEKACRKKYAALARIPSEDGASKQRGHQRPKKTAARATEVDEHHGHYWIDENTLRDSCAFFRTGESTARAILSVLRTLGRLKQVCGRHSQVTYILQYDPPSSV